MIRELSTHILLIAEAHMLEMGSNDILLHLTDWSVYEDR